MRPGDRANTVRNLRNIAQSIEEQANTIENGSRPNLLNVGYGGREDGTGPIDLGYGAFHLTVMEARLLVSKLLTAIYSLGGNGNTPGQKHEPIELAFIEALKTGLSFSLTEEQIVNVLTKAEDDMPRPMLHEMVPAPTPSARWFSTSPTSWIPKEECRDRFLYRIHSRNLAFGVFRTATGGFIGLRTKFGSVYAFEEYHWDNESFATVKPEEQLEELPAEIVLDTGLGSRCHNCGKACAYINFPDGPREKDYGGGQKTSISGEWKHTEPSDCTEVLAYGEPNAPLEQWLHEMEKKYESAT